MTCAICGFEFRGGIPAETMKLHPIHTDAELAETKAAVDAAARALSALFFLGMARQVSR